MIKKLSPDINSIFRNDAQTNTLSATFISKPTISIVIPALNEADNLPHVLPRIPHWIDEVILVDGHSTDDTVAVAERLWPDIRIVHQYGRGKGSALREGFSVATGDIIVMLDADGSMDPIEIPLYIGALLSGADFAKGTRFIQGGNTHDMSFIRYCGNLGLTWLVRLIFGGKYSDLCYGYNAFWRDILPALALDADGFEIETLMNVRILLSQLKVIEIASMEHKRIYGISNLHAVRDGWRVLKTIIKERMQNNVLPLIDLHRNSGLIHPPFFQESDAGVSDLMDPPLVKD